MSDLTQSPVNELVVVGSSSGGIEALSVLVRTFPVNFPAPVVIAQHLDPNYPSNLAAILRRQAQLSVVEVESDCALERGVIYVIPSDKHVVILDGHVAVENHGADRPRPSVDLLLTSAAETYGDRLYAVILTGQGSDGAAGSAEAKRLGGTIVVQNPATARYPSMPLSLPPTIVDFKVELDQIGPLLHNLLTGISGAQAQAPTEDILLKILDEISHRFSIDFRPYKRASLLRRIHRRMAALQIQLLGQYLEYIQNHPEEVGQLMSTILINVTEFFRDPEAYSYLKSDILPVIIESARSRNQTLRVWSAGCATGEEPYSIAMLLTDLLGGEIAHWSIKIFATDLDETAISFARQGLYAEPLLKSVPEDYRERFFTQVDGSYRVARDIRQLVTFGRQDLGHSGPFPHINLVLCRNVLIYFNTELQSIVLNNFAFALQPDGYLFLGKAETATSSQSHYELVTKTWKIYRCVGIAPQLPRRLGLTSLAPPEKLVNALPSLPVKAGIDFVKPPQVELSQLRRTNELLLRFLPMGIVVIDRGYHLVTANAAVRRLLGLHDTGQGMDFLHAVRGIPYETVRSAIDKAFRERTTVSLSEIELKANAGGTGRFISFAISSIQTATTAPELAAISITDITEYVQMRQKFEASQTEQLRLLEEFNTVNSQLADRNKELLDSNEELQISNEDLIMTHEELQSVLEEYETTNEELQAANEEYETTNEETQAINEELQATNDELRVRTQELHELAAVLESEQKQLQELSQQLLTAQEVERQNIARELHDQIGQDLTAIQLLLGAYRSDNDNHSINQALNIVKELIRKVRDRALDLGPSLLDDLGLLAALTWYFQRYTEQMKVQVEFQEQGLDQRFSPDIELAVYRIVQEALTNVARYAGIQKVTVAIWTQNNMLHVRIQDIGVGFDLQKASNGFGLRSMKERARILGAELVIYSTPGQGTQISVGLPLPDPNQDKAPQ